MSLYGPIAKLEEERRLRRLAELNRKFGQVIGRMESVQKASIDVGKAKKAILDEASKKSPEVKVMYAKPVVTQKPVKHKPVSRKGRKR